MKRSCYSTAARAAVLAILAAAAATTSAATLAMSPDVREALRWVVTTKDNGGVPFIVIDKRNARAWVYDAQAQAIGSSPVLLGLAQGDDSVPGIGERPIEDIAPQERTTPAGRFVIEPGRNMNGEDIFWVDYDAAVSMHRVRTHNTRERRLQRLASADVSDNRISYGCINVPVGFYDNVIQPAFGQTRGVVYVLPETRPVRTLFRLSQDIAAGAASTAAPLGGSPVASPAARPATFKAPGI